MINLIFEFFKKTYTLEQAFDILENIYADRQIKFIYEDSIKYYFTLSIPTTTEWYVDPSINRNFKILPYWYRLKCNGGKVFFMTHFHSNVLLANEYFKNKSNYIFQTIIHYDDHMDMMPIYLPKKNSFYNTKKQLIEMSIVSIGNFLTYYFFENKNTLFQVIHVKKNSKESKVYPFHLKESDKHIGSSIFRMNEVVLGFGNHTYTKCTSENLAPEVNKPIWLDIDLDYFYNKYNRDSDWKINKNTIHYNARELKKIFKDELQNIVSSEWFNHVSLLTIATSPGFFPFEFLSTAHSDFIQPLYKEYMKNELIGY